MVLPPLEPNGLEVVLAWPEADLGVTTTVQCPCGNLSALEEVGLNREGTRECGGDFRTGAVWEEPMVAACNFSIATRRLCQIAEVSCMLYLTINNNHYLN